MNPEMTKKLFKEYPDLFKRALLTDCFDCQDGWFALLAELACQVRQHRDHSFEPEKLEIIQVRQEMGALRINFRGGNEVIRKLIEEAEDKSKLICALDGEPASGLCVCAPHWYRYLCDTCADLHDYMIIEDFHPKNCEIAPTQIQV